MNWGYFFSVLISLLTVVFLYFQASALTRSLRTESYQHIVTSQIEIDKLFLVHPELRPFLYEDVELPDPETELGRKARVIIDIALNVIDSTHQQRHLIPKEMLPSWLHYASETTNRPAVKQFLKENPYWYPFAISGEYDRLLGKIES
jgi:hypothetical protein